MLMLMTRGYWPALAAFAARSLLTWPPRWLVGGIELLLLELEAIGPEALITLMLVRLN